jgi:hypothetical protein
MVRAVRRRDLVGPWVYVKEQLTAAGDRPPYFPPLTIILKNSSWFFT